CLLNMNVLKSDLIQLREQLGYFLEEELIGEIFRVGRRYKFEANDVVMYPGDTIDMIPIVMSGALKISRENNEGEELLLYYIEGGETCAMTVQCCVRNKHSEIRATVVEPAELLMIPIGMMDDWM